MKKVIAIVAVFVISILGLSSYNTNEVKKNETNSTLLASLNNGGVGSGTGGNGTIATGTGNGNGSGNSAGNKKID